MGNRKSVGLAVALRVSGSARHVDALGVGPGLAEPGPDGEWGTDDDHT